MSLNAATIEILIAKGLTAADLLEVARATEVKGDRTNAERQARHRRKRNGVTVTVPAPKEDTSKPVSSEPEGSPETLPIPGGREVRYHRLPEGWTPTRALPSKTLAKADQWPPGALEDELEALHRWAVNAENKQGKGRKLDWDRAWVNWIERRHDEHYGRARTNGMGRHQSGDGLSSTTRAAAAVFGTAPARQPRDVPG